MWNILLASRRVTLTEWRALGLHEAQRGDRFPLRPPDRHRLTTRASEVVPAGKSEIFDPNQGRKSDGVHAAGGELRKNPLPLFGGHAPAPVGVGRDRPVSSIGVIAQTL